MNLLHQSEHQRVFEHHVMFLSTGHSHLGKHFSQHVFHGLLASALFVFHVLANTGLAGFQVPKPAKPVLTKQDEKVCDPGEAKPFLKQTEIKTCWHVYHHSSRVVGKNWVRMGEKMLGGCLTNPQSLQDHPCDRKNLNIWLPLCPLSISPQNDMADIAFM